MGDLTELQDHPEPTSGWLDYLKVVLDPNINLPHISFWGAAAKVRFSLNHIPIGIDV